MRFYSILFGLGFLMGGCGTTPRDTFIDNDGDGVPAHEDCDDANADIYPGAPEHCGSPLVDNNCDGQVGGLDEDADGFRACDDCDDTDED